MLANFKKKNLGKHVKHVLFDGVPEDLLSKMMQKLLDCGCDEIESLGKILYRKKEEGGKWTALKENIN